MSQDERTQRTGSFAGAIESYALPEDCDPIPGLATLSIECPAGSGYIGSVIQRILLFVFIAWFAIAPAIASSCVSECDKTNAESTVVHPVEEHAEADQQTALPDCHQAQNGEEQSRDNDAPSTGAMAAACFVAAAVTMHASIASPVTIDLSTEHDVLVLLPSASFESSPPYKPPRA
jgi:hypothetical protein